MCYIMLRANEWIVLYAAYIVESGFFCGEGTDVIIRKVSFVDSDIVTCLHVFFYKPIILGNMRLECYHCIFDCP